jgi:hypothetical protein
MGARAPLPCRCQPYQTDVAKDFFPGKVGKSAVRLFFYRFSPLSCLAMSNTRRGWANVPRWGERQRRWPAALLPLP